LLHKKEGRSIVTEKIRLMFVDDEEDFVDYMTKHLERNNLEVRAFSSPVRALKETGGQTFDVGILDLKMPGMNGEELLKKLKERDPGMEIIILTGHGSIESAFQTSKDGAYEYLNKPCDFDVLLSAINNAYAKRIKNLNREQSERVNELMKSAGSLSPLGLLKRLKRIRGPKK
jgi:two-component system response regulator RegA